MKVAVFANSDWNLFNYRKFLISSLLSQGYDVVAMAPGVTYKKEIEGLGCSYIEIRNISRKGVNPIVDFSLVRELSIIYKRENIDLVLSYTIKPNIYGALATVFNSTKSISTVTGLGSSFLIGGLINVISKFLYKTAFKFSSAVVFQNRDDLNLFESKGIVSVQKTNLIRGSGIDLNHFRSSGPIASKKFQLLFVGRLLTDKGIIELLEAFSNVSVNHKNVVLVILGGVDVGNPTSITQEVIDKYDSDAINFLGHQSNIKNFIEESDAVVLPSYREGLPRVLLEAMSMSKPIIGSDVAGCREVVNNEVNGFLVKPQDVASLELSILKMIELTDIERFKMGDEGREMVEKYFSDQVICGQYLDLIKKII